MAGPGPSIGDFLKQARLQLGLSQREAAKLVGIAHSRIGEVERGIDGRTGKAFKPSYVLLLKIAKGYQLDPRDLLLRGGHDPGWLELTSDEWSLVALFRQMSSDEQDQLLAGLKKASQSP